MSLLRHFARGLQKLGYPGPAAELLLVAARRSGATKDVKQLVRALTQFPEIDKQHRLLDRLWNAKYRAESRSHGLPARLIVSLTSYPGRYPTLHYTLRCLLDQSVRADRTVLWIAHQDLGSLPDNVVALQGQGLEIRSCEDIRSYKKIVPVIEEEPDAFIVTADDDLYYPADWLATLVDHASEHPGRIVARRARRIQLNADGRPEPYERWELISRRGGVGRRLVESAVGEAEHLVFPTGVGGVLYPPGALRSEGGVLGMILKLAPNADDVGLYWLWRMNGMTASVVEAEKFHVADWPGSQAQTLMSGNVGGQGNDRQIEDLINYFGAAVLEHESLPESVSRSVEIQTRDGYRVRVDPSDRIGRQIVERGAYDGPSLDAIAPVLSKLKPRTLLDIGANIGNHSLAWANQCQSLHAFEPNSKAYAFLKYNVEANSLANVVPLNFGLSEVSAKRELYIQTRGNLGASSLHNRNEHAEVETVDLRKGDEYIASRNIVDLDFIKVDVEGHERYVFLGLREALVRCRPLVLTEWSAESSERGWLDDAVLMQELFPAYEVYALITSTDRSYWSMRRFGSLQLLGLKIRLQKKRRVLLRMSDEREPPRSTKDLLLVPKEKAWCLSGSEIFA